MTSGYIVLYVLFMFQTALLFIVIWLWNRDVKRHLSFFKELKDLLDSLKNKAETLANERREDKEQMAGEAASDFERGN